MLTEKVSCVGASATDEDFNWDDDEDEDTATPPAPKETSAASDEIPNPPKTPESLQPPVISSDTVLSDSKSYPTSLVTSPSNTSPRGSSEEGSYDVVSNASASVSQDVKKATAEDDGEDSDWE